MRKIVLLFTLLIINTLSLLAQINQSIQIVRDEWGVPHIFAKTDAEAAYGLAWANAEDDFNSMQEHLLASQSRLAEVKGKDGARLDVIAHLIGVKELVDTAYKANTFSPHFQQVISAYVAGVNAYALAHPREVWLKGTFPITEKDLIKSYVLGLTLFTGMPNELGKVLSGHIKKDESQINFGSNALAISGKRTTDGKTYLAINSHQPLQGPFAWYEFHLQSEEGWHVLGGTLPGFLSMGHGVNENLGWAHTVNYLDFTDVYKLEMNPDNELQYKLDGKWENLQKRSIKLKIKLGFLKVSKKFTFYWSKYGTTVKKDKDFYSLRFAANQVIQGSEQQFRMNKARNWLEFKTALEMQKLPSFNIVYADREHNIFYISNGLVPYRDKNYDWRKVLPGNTTKTLWSPKYHPISELAQTFNPPSGYVFNTNNTPFNSTAEGESPQKEDFDPTMGEIPFDNNRSNRLQELMKEMSGKKISYEDFKKVKYDLQYPTKLYFYNAQNLEDIFNISPEKYPNLKESIQILQKWDRKNDKSSVGASVFLLTWHHLRKKLGQENRNYPDNKVTEADFVESLTWAQNHLQKYFKSVQVPLGNLQRHQRGKVDLPMAGNFDVIASMDAEPDKNGKMITRQGESYISLVKFGEQGVEIETVNTYGASARPESPNYTDQMQLFTNQQLKPMTMDKAEIMKKAKKVYSPK